VDETNLQSSAGGITGSSSRGGFVAALAAYLAWGLFPLYFRALRQISPFAILAHRVVWSAAFLLLVLASTGRLHGVRRALLGPGALTYLASTALISSNWLLFIWAVNSGHVLDTSLGYFINPLINVLLGVACFRERLTRSQAVAVALAGVGVLALAIEQASVPWISLALAVTFGLYGLVRKRAKIEPVEGLFIETAILAPLAVFYLGILSACGAPLFGSTAPIGALLLSTGVVTATPLIWFAMGVRTLRLSTMGLIQYVSPTSQFLIAVGLYRESFTRAHGAAFACIWLALALYTWDTLRRATRVGGRERLGPYPR
jgi:chloramphenicol-sensitive protein RarD